MAKELTEEEKGKIKAKSTGQVLEDFYISQVDKKGKNQEQIKSAALDLYLKSITDKDDAILAEKQRLEAEAAAEDEKFNANLKQQRDIKSAQASQVAPTYKTQEDLQAQAAADERPRSYPNKLGGGLRQSLGEGLESFNKGAETAGEAILEYVAEPIANAPKTLGNAALATGEFFSGLAGSPAEYKRYSTTDIPTKFDPEPPASPTPPQPLSEESKPEAPPAQPKKTLNNAYAVSLYKREDKNKTFDNLKDAQDYFKAQGGKGAIATFKDRRTDKKSAEALAEEYRQKYKPNEKVWRPEVLAAEAKQKEEDKKSGRYADFEKRAAKFAFGKQDEAKATQVRNKENQEAAKARIAQGFLLSGGRSLLDDQVAASKKRDAANKASSEKFQERITSKDNALNSYNEYNKEKGLLNKAYNAALKSEDYGAALRLKQAMTRQSRGVPTEAGARRKYFEETQIEREKASIEAEETRRKKEAYDLAILEENRKANQRYVASNPDANLNK